MLKIKTLVVSHFEQNARILFDTESHSACIIDPGANCEEIFIESEIDTYTISSIFLTHCHIDHGGGVSKLLSLIEKKTGEKPPLYYHSEEEPLGRSIEFSCKQYGLPPIYDNVPKATVLSDTLKTFSVGNIQSSLLFLPGHSPGHTGLFFSKQEVVLITNKKEKKLTAPILIGGDVLFKHSIGRTDLPLSDHLTLIKSIKTTLFPLPESTLVLSGHGPDTTIGDEKKNNPYLQNI